MQKTCCLQSVSKTFRSGINNVNSHNDNLLPKHDNRIRVSRKRISKIRSGSLHPDSFRKNPGRRIGKIFVIQFSTQSIYFHISLGMKPDKFIWLRRTSGEVFTTCRITSSRASFVVAVTSSSPFTSLHKRNGW